MKNRKITLPILHNATVFIATLLLLSSTNVNAGNGIRQVLPIHGANQLRAPQLNTAEVVNPKPLPRVLVEKKLQEVLDAWNTNKMESTLGDELYDRARLNQAVQRNVPKDAKLRLLSVQGVQTLQQYRLEPTVDSGAKLVSIVSALANTQLEYQGSNGLVSLPGRNEYRLKITQALSNDSAGR